MPSFTDVTSGASALASDVQQIIDSLKGTSGKGVPLSAAQVECHAGNLIGAVDSIPNIFTNLRTFRVLEGIR